MNPYQQYTLKFEFGRKKLKNPWGIAICKNGDYLVCDGQGNRVCIFDSTGKHLGQLPGKLTYPFGVVLDEEGNAYITCCSSGVACYDKDRRFVQQFGLGRDKLHDPHGITWDPEGNLAVADQGKGQIVFFTREGEFIRSFGEKGTADHQLNNPSSLKHDSKGNLYVVDPGAPEPHRCLKKFDADGNFLQVISCPDPITCLFECNCVDIDENGNIVVVDTVSSTVQAITQTGQSLFAIPVPWPTFVMIDRVGNVLICHTTGEDRCVSVYGWS